MKLLATLLLALFAVTISAQDSSIKVIDKAPRFPSTCEDNTSLSDDEKQLCSTKEMLAFIYGNLVYPPSAKERGLKGTVKVKIKVDEDGFIWNPIVVSSAHSILDAAALQVIKKMQDEMVWIPAEYEGEAVESSMVLYIRFNQNEEPRKNPFTVPEVLPRFPSSCEEAPRLTEVEKKQCADEEMLEYVYNRLVYPLEAQERELKGTVIIDFTIDEFGQMRNLTISKSLDPILDNAAMDVVQRMKEQVTWIPKLKSGNPIATEFSLPIRFRGW